MNSCLPGVPGVRRGVSAPGQLNSAFDHTEIRKPFRVHVRAQAIRRTPSPCTWGAVWFGPWCLTVHAVHARDLRIARMPAGSVTCTLVSVLNRP